MMSSADLIPSFTPGEAARLALLRARVTRGILAGDTAPAPEEAPTARLMFVRWLVATGRLTDAR